MATTPITVTVTGQTTPQFTGMFDKAKDYIKNFRQTINTNLLNTMGAATMASKAIGYVTSTMREVTAEAKKFEQQSARLGVAPEQIAKLNKLSEESGVPFRAITKGLNQVKKAAAEALIDPNSDMAETFKKLGIDAATLGEASKDPMMVFGQISDKINEIADDSEQLKAIEAVFKQNGFMLKGMIEMGSKGQRELVEGNTTMGALTIAQNAEMKDAWEKFWDVIKNGFAMFGIVLNPIVQLLRILLNVIQLLIQGAWTLTMVLKAIFGAALITIIFGVVGAITALVQAVGYLVTALGYLTFSDKMKQAGRDTIAFAKEMRKEAGGMMKEAFKAQGEDLGDSLKSGIERAAGDAEDIIAAGKGAVKGYSPEEEKAEGERRFKQEQDLTEARKKYNDEVRKGMLIGADDIVKRRELEMELEEIKKEGWKFASAKQKETKEYYEWLTRQQTKLNEIEAIRRAEEEKNRKGREALDKAAEDYEKKTREEAIATEQRMSQERFNMHKVFEDIALKMKEDKMRAAGATEDEIKLANLDTETKRLEAMQKDVDKFLNGMSLETAMQLNPEETTKIMQEFGGQLAKVRGIGASLLGGKTSVDIADDARKRGMGGQVSSVVSGSAIPKAQLDKLTKIETNTGVLAERLLRITGGGESTLATVRGSKTRAEAKLSGDGAIPL